MSTLIFQIHIKKWEKNQRSNDDVAARAALPDRYPIEAAPEFFVLNRPCIIDQYNDGNAINTDANISRPLKTALMKDGSITLERFSVTQKENRLILGYDANDAESIDVGSLNETWIQACFTWRYAVEQDGHMYWLYEEITLNAACVETYDRDYFLTGEPALIFNGD
jgi:hypothetical protein